MTERGSGDKPDETEQDDKGHHAGVAFHVDIDAEGEKRPRSSVPKRFRHYKKKTVTKEELDRQQMEAESRRKEKEQEMLQRIHRAQDDVANLNKNFSALLEVDAKQQGAEGVSEGPALSRHQLKEKFRAVNADYRKMVTAIASNTSYAE